MKPTQRPSTPFIGPPATSLSPCRRHEFLMQRPSYSGVGPRHQPIFQRPKSLRFLPPRYHPSFCTSCV